MDQQRKLEGLSILVVEDEYFIADELKQLLKAHGAKTVRISGQLADAAAQIQKEGFEIALLDINIRGDRVYLLADELKRQQISFAFVTGYDRKEVPARFADVPLWGKPFNNDQLMENIYRLRNATL